MKGKILLIAVIVVAASVLVVLSFIYPEETVEIPISGTLSPGKAEHYILGHLKHNSAVGLNIDLDGDYENIRLAIIDVKDNSTVYSGDGWIPEHGTFMIAAGIFYSCSYYMLEMEPEGDGNYPLSYNGTISITQRGMWWW